MIGVRGQCSGCGAWGVIPDGYLDGHAAYPPCPVEGCRGHLRRAYEPFEPPGDGPITAEQALDGINLIRNSIVGAQSINWSEHIYPLVALLNRAGQEGLPYPKARANVGTLIEFREEALPLLRATRGEALTHELHDRIAAFLDRVDPSSIASSEEREP